jgi:hypothetical protein
MQTETVLSFFFIPISFGNLSEKETLSTSVTLISDAPASFLDIIKVVCERNNYRISLSIT